MHLTLYETEDGRVLALSIRAYGGMGIIPAYSAQTAFTGGTPLSRVTMR